MGLDNSASPGNSQRPTQAGFHTITDPCSATVSAVTGVNNTQKLTEADPDSPHSSHHTPVLREDGRCQGIMDKCQHFPSSDCREKYKYFLNGLHGAVDGKLCAPSQNIGSSTHLIIRQQTSIMSPHPKKRNRCQINRRTELHTSKYTENNRKVSYYSSVS